MDLLIFAHQREADTFLQSAQFQKLPLQHGVELFKGTDFLILITGEGKDLAGTKAAIALTQYAIDIDRVINLGVAGSLTSTLTPHQVISVRTVYGAQQIARMEFKSFSTFDSQARYDLVTSEQRILSDEAAAPLRAHAQLVDREAWSIGFVSHIFSKPFGVVKVVSDQAGPQTDCLLVSQQGIAYSQALLQFYNKHFRSQALAPEGPREAVQNDFEGFHFSFTQSNQVKDLINKGALIVESELNHLRGMDISPKRRSEFLIKSLQTQLNPLQAKINQLSQSALEPLRRAGLKVATDPTLESTHVDLRIRLQSPKDLQKLKKGIEEFDMNRWLNIFSGML